MRTIIKTYILRQKTNPETLVIIYSFIFGKVDILESLKEGILGTSALEGVGVLFGILYLLFIANKSKWGWLFALVNTSCYIYVCFQAHLFLETGLQVFYFGMAIYGWLSWNKPSKNENKTPFIVTKSVKFHLYCFLIGSIISIILGWLMLEFTTQKLPYLDAFIIVFSLFTTYLTTQVILENWMYWIIIDFFAFYLYVSQGLYFSGLLYIIYIVIAIFAFFSWYKNYKTQSA